MLHPSRIILACAIVLMLVAFGAGFYGLVNFARMGHSTDVHRDDVMSAIDTLAKAGAITKDYDKAAAMVGEPAYGGSTPEQRTAFEQRVDWKISFFCTDAMEERVRNDIAVASLVGFGVGIACLVLAIVVGVQAWRV